MADEMITVAGRLMFSEHAFIVSTALWVVMLLAACVGVELESWKAKNLAELGFWLTPFALLALASRIRPSRLRTKSMIASGILLALSVLPASCSGLNVLFQGEGDFDSSFEIISKKSFGNRHSRPQ